MANTGYGVFPIVRGLLHTPSALPATPATAERYCSSGRRLKTRDAVEGARGALVYTGVTSLAQKWKY